MITHKPRDQSHYLTGCSGKIRYHSASEAAKQKRKMRKFEGQTLSIYQCRYCKNWHLGRKAK